jgi:rhodanese-related sulfurtransferase
MKVSKFLAGFFTAAMLQSALMAGLFSSYNYISPEETAKLIRETPSQVALVDIQVKEGFTKEHLKGALATYAYPVKTDAEKARLAELLPSFKAGQKIVIVCPRGGGGAKRAYDFYVEKGVSKEQLLILTKGQEGWPREKISDVLAK